MTASGEVIPEHTELERWHRRLLWAYPIGYRRTHGQEILTTLMDSAEPGQRKPHQADVADLLRGALRQWFRLPTGKSAVIAAVLTAMTLGAVGAASASWLAWHTTVDLPSDTAAVQTAETVSGVPLTTPEVHRYDSPRTLWRGVTVSAAQPLSVPNWSVDHAQERLRADGWTSGPVTTISDSSRNEGWDERREKLVQRFQATRGGLVLTATTVTTPSGTVLSTGEISPAQPTWEPGAILLGWLVGAGTGWVLTGWTMYRLRRRSLPHRLAAFALGITALGFAATSTVSLYGTLAEPVFTDPPGIYPFAPTYRWIVVSPAAEYVGVALVIGLTILVLAATGRNQTTVQPTATTT
ncbi:hypothetical protein [Salinispora mooreana]|uniref:hypothetical protein n=1 Tax=Salinispora mooreana TaxID=999545 RepID=UPI000371BC27|nr:hypothetical protein [Salinispora mooreana]